MSNSTIEDRLLRTISNLAINSTQENSSTYAEIYAVARETELLKDLLDSVHSEMFISTSEGYGLSIRENRFGVAPSDLTVSERRNFLINRRKFMCNCICPAMYGELFSLLNCSGVVLKDNQNKKLIFNISGDYTPLQVTMICGHIKGLLPVNWDIEINFG